MQWPTLQVKPVQNPILTNNQPQIANPPIIGKNHSSGGSPNIQPTFHFLQQYTGPGHEQFKFVGGRSPIPTPKVNFSQNFDPSQLSLYSDGKGNKWYEDDNTGQRYPIPVPNPKNGDVQVRPNTPFNRLMSSGVQYQHGLTPPPTFSI